VPGGAGGGAAAWIDQARQALQAAADPALPGAAHPAFTVAAGRVWAALDRMDEGLAARDPRFFVALRDGSRALVELRTVAARPARSEGMPASGRAGGSGGGGAGLASGGAGGAGGGEADLDAESAARLASLTGVFRQLRRSYGAEEIRHRAGGPLRAAEGRQLARLAATAREWGARVREAEFAAGSEARDAARLGDLRRLGALLDRIAAAPATLAGYLNALTRADVALGTWSGMLALAARGEVVPSGPDAAAGGGGSEGNGDAAGSLASAGSGDAGGSLENVASAGSGGVEAGGTDSAAGSLGALATAGEVLAGDAGVGFVFAAELDSGRTWSYLKQGGGVGGAAGVSGAWSGGSDLDPFDEYDEGGPPLDAASLATPPPGGEAAVPGAGNPALAWGGPDAAGQDLVAGGMGAAAVERRERGDWEAPANGEDAGAVMGPGSPPAASSGEELARRLGGRFAGGRIVIHGGVAGGLAGGLADAGGEARVDAGAGAGADETPWAWSEPWAGADALLDWLEGAPALCSPLPPRCGP
jgi:hypothetical protein